MHLYLTPISLVYILSGLIGFTVSTIALPHYLFTYRAGQSLTVELDRRRAHLINIGIVITEGIRLSIHLLTTAVGIQSLFVSPAPPVTSASTFHQVFGLEVLAILLWANIATTINSTMVYAQYRLLRSRRRADREDKAARNVLAKLKWQVRGLARQQEKNTGRIEAAEGRADVAEARADVSSARADVVDVQQVVQDTRIDTTEVRITTVEEVVEVPATPPEGTL